MPTTPTESLANSRDVSSQDEALLPIIRKFTELCDSQITGTMIAGDFVWRGIAPLQRRSQPMWETRQEIGSRISPEMLKGKMFFLLPGERHDLPPGDFSLLDRSARGDAVPPMPPCNAYGLQGTEFLDPAPMPRATTRGRSWMAVRPPFGDFPPDEYGVFDDEEEEEEGPEEQGHARPPASSQGEGEMPASGGEAGVELPPGQPAPPTLPAGQKSGEESEALQPPIPVEDGDDKSMSMPDPFEDLAGKRWGFSSTKRARR